jgi:hypothetical protein
MEEKDRWGAQVEYLKLAIALSTTLIAAAAVIYVDEAKIPTDSLSRAALLLGVGCFLCLLVASAASLGLLSNHLVYFQAPAQNLATAAAPGATSTNPLPLNKYVRWSLHLANASFSFLCLAAIIFAGFFGVRSFASRPPAFERAIALGKSGLVLDPSKNETATLKSVDLQGDAYSMTFVLSPGGGIATAVVDNNGDRLKSVKKP